MSAPSTVTSLFLEQPDRAVSEAFIRYRDRLALLAREQFDAWLREQADPDGVVQSVFRTFFRRAQLGELELASWEHVWNLLARITRLRCINRLEQLQAQQRNISRQVPLDLAPDLAFVDHQPTPDEAAELSDLIARLLRSFEGRHRAIVERILQGAGAADIARELEVSRRTVERAREQLRARLERLQERDDDHRH